MVMTNGIGASLGTFLAGECVVNPLVMSRPETDYVGRLNGWHESWLIFAAYALIVAILFYFCFKKPGTEASKSEIEKSENADAEDAGGMVESAK